MQQASYLGTAVTKAARGEGMGAFSAKNANLPRRMCERKVTQNEEVN